MTFLSYDLEFATTREGKFKICEFGYVLTDESFKIIEEDNFKINPKISKSEWDYYALVKIMKKTVGEFEKSPIFPVYYKKISSLIKNADYIIGHSLNGDANALNQECQRYKRPNIDYDFYDVKPLFKSYTKAPKDTSVKDMIKYFEIDGDKNIHSAHADAYNTMLVLKKLLEVQSVSFEQLISLCPEAKDRSENYTVLSFEKNRQKKEKEKREKNIYHHFVINGKKENEGTDILKGKTVSMSENYVRAHYRQAANIVQKILDEGGKYTENAISSDIFIKYSITKSDGTEKEDKRMKKIIEADGKAEIMDFKDFLKMLGITEEYLNKLPYVSEECFYGEKYYKIMGSNRSD